MAENDSERRMIGQAVLTTKFFFIFFSAHNLIDLFFCFVAWCRGTVAFSISHGCSVASTICCGLRSDKWKTGYQPRGV